MRRVLLTLALLLSAGLAQAQPIRPSPAWLRFYMPIRPQLMPGAGGTSFPVLDTTFKVCDDADVTKCVTFGNLGGITTANTVAPLTFTGTAAAPLLNITNQLLVFGSWNVNGAGDLVGLNSGKLGFISAAGAGFSATAETYFTRLTAGVFGTNLWVQNTGGRSMLASDYTNATAAFTNTALSVTVISGRKYTFQLTLFLIDSTAADGAQIDFNGGTAAATNFRVHCTHFDTTATVLKNTQVAALATVADSVATTGTGQNEVMCEGSFEPSGAGTFIVRGAQVAHTTGTLTVNRGSWLWVEDMP